MVNYFLALVLILTIAITCGSILIASHLRTTYKSDFFSTLLFFHVFYFTFGFYALWGQMIVNSFISPFVTSDLLGKVTDITALLGTPFLIFASLMFIRFSKELSGHRTGNLFVILYIATHIILIFGIGYFLIKFPVFKIFTVVKYYFILFSFGYTLYGVLCLLSRHGKQTMLRYADRRNIAFGTFLMILVQNVMLSLYNENVYLGLLFIFIYFIPGGFITVYIKYKADLSVLLPEVETTKTFEQFCEKFEISRREKEIINEICKGLTNQQIADKLFISLQTVKDHTHRIYSKTVCTSRAQLIRMVNESS